MKKEKDLVLSEEDLNRLIEMAWEDRTPFEAIYSQFSLKENDVRQLMRQHLHPGSFRNWRKRVSGRKTKHQQLRAEADYGFKCKEQRSITRNKISKKRY